MVIGNYVEQVELDDRIILANRKSGQWIRMSKEVFFAIKYIIENEIKIEESLILFEESEDFLFVKKVYEDLIDTQIICCGNLIDNESHKLISLQLTNRCNLRCIHCCVDANAVDVVYEDLSTKQIKSIFDKMIGWKPSNIMLSGGEPMIRNDFIELLEYLKLNYDGKIILSTNSLFINKGNVDILKECCYKIDISIDGVDEESCSLIRGKGVFEKVCNKVELLHSSGYNKISLSMTFSDKNYQLIPKFYKLNEKLGTTAICRILAKEGRGAVNSHVLSTIDDDDIYIPPDYLSKDYNKPFGVSTCSAGKKELFIGCDGTLYPCPSYMADEYSLGNVLECNALDELLIEKEGFYACEKVSVDNPIDLPECSMCKVRLFCWTCPAEIRRIKTKKAFESRCRKIKPVLYQRIWEKSEK